MKAENSKLPVVVKSKTTGEIYQWHGDNKFENLSRGICGRIPQEIASENLSINLDLQGLVQKNPILIELIKNLRLKVEIN